MSDEENRVMYVAHEIEQYFQNHPNAADSLEGITKWWILRKGVEEAVFVVFEALAILERQGKLTKTVSIDGKEIYSRSKKPLPM